MGQVIVVKSCRYLDKKLNVVVHVVTRCDAVRFSMRWSGGELRVTCPDNMPVEKFYEYLYRLAPRAMATEKRLRYNIGDTIQCPDYAIRLQNSPHADKRLSATIGSDEATVLIGRALDLDSREAPIAISNMLMRVAARVAPAKLIPRARFLADELGINVTYFEISRGRRTLGRCYSGGHISLSAALLFLPFHLRDYVILHEFAHRSHMNHSADFHSVLATYLPISEKELEAELRAFAWPVTH